MRRFEFWLTLLSSAASSLIFGRQLFFGSYLGIWIQVRCQVFSCPLSNSKAFQDYSFLQRNGNYQPLFLSLVLLAMIPIHFHVLPVTRPKIFHFVPSLHSSFPSEAKTTFTTVKDPGKYILT